MDKKKQRLCRIVTSGHARIHSYQYFRGIKLKQPSRSHCRQVVDTRALVEAGFWNSNARAYCLPGCTALCYLQVSSLLPFRTRAGFSHPSVMDGTAIPPSEDFACLESIGSDRIAANVGIRVLNGDPSGMEVGPVGRGAFHRLRGARRRDRWVVALRSWKSSWREIRPCRRSFGSTMVVEVAWVGEVSYTISGRPA